MKKNFTSALLILTIALTLWSCGKDDKTTNPGETTMPVITSLTADKYEIVSGGLDLAIINCVAKGGSLTYTWAVDLGDIVPLNEDHSKVSFAGSDCCSGEKVITCTVSNDKGSVSDTIKIALKTE